MKEMYTQCPNCLTIFILREPQLQAHQGLVRCGKCASVFRADQYLLDKLPERKGEPQDDSGGAEEQLSQTEQLGKTKRRGSGSKSKPRGHRTSTKPKKSIQKREDLDIPTVTELSLLPKPKIRTRPIFWVVGNLILLALLVGQLTYFYRNELVNYPNLKPIVVTFCQQLRCEIHPRRNVALIELTRTAIAPHPKYSNTLRIRSSLVNRAGFTQPFPLMEISLSNKTGELLSRRSFRPEEYLNQSDIVAKGMPPNVAVDTVLSVTNPDKSAVGYEILLHAP